MSDLRLDAAQTSLNAVRNRATKDRKRRVKLRDKLRAEGIDEQLIDKIIEQQRHDDLSKRHGEDVRLVLRANASKGPDDSKFQPVVGDPLLRGAARVGGVTAKVVRRRNTITEFEYDREAS